jgi:four helix bundle protein
MRKQTLNAKFSKFNIEWLGIREDEEAYGPKAETLNVQRSTLNVQQGSESRIDLEERLLEFSSRIIRLVDALPNTRAANHLAGQLLRCGTSPLGNHGEVQAAESRRDFVHKLRICLKEFKETRRWLRLLQYSELVPAAKMALILQETEELIKIFAASVRTAEKNAK